MSYRALNWAWEADLPMTQKFVLIALADMADEKETCYPGQERLAQMTGTSVSTVRRAVKSLESMEAITRQARGVSGGGRTSDRYFLNTNRSLCTVGGNRSSDESKPVNHDAETGQGDRGTPREPLEEPPALLSLSSDATAEVQISRQVEAMWSLWPASRRSTKKVVEKSLRAALKVAPWGEIHEAGREHALVWSTWPASDVKYVPLLSTWLNQERWSGAKPEPRTDRLTPLDAGRAADEILARSDQALERQISYARSPM